MSDGFTHITLSKYRKLVSQNSQNSDVHFAI